MCDEGQSRPREAGPARRMVGVAKSTDSTMAAVSVVIDLAGNVLELMACVLAGIRERERRVQST